VRRRKEDRIEESETRKHDRRESRVEESEKKEGRQNRGK
jgi:hypothetical protein